MALNQLQARPAVLFILFISMYPQARTGKKTAPESSCVRLIEIVRYRPFSDSILATLLKSLLKILKLPGSWGIGEWRMSHL
ncbi:hypothetical protein GGU11DRAFT_103273 [Lentinula aff. detonsa]|nr:hypothetical protein GGU11DRAFT_103273 [Lentinula aff. detonsa]